MLCCRYR